MPSNNRTELHRRRDTCALWLIPILLAAPAWSADTNAARTNDAVPAVIEEAAQPQRGQTSETNNRLRRALKRFPAADANGDGVLTMEEARVFREKSVREPTVVAKAEAGTNNVALPDPPTFADMKYGSHPRNVLDFWQADSVKPAPVVVFIHGGGFQAGDKSQARKDPLRKQFLDAGISFAAINYRFRQQAPIQDILRDAARAIQFIRYKAADWNVDKKRIGAYGGSAGAGTSLWLAARDDLADPKNPDPVLRESSRIAAAGLFSTQATYDLLRWETFLGPFKPEWLQSPNEIPEFYHLNTAADLKAPEGERVRAECDMLRWLSKDDPPIFALTTQPGGPSQSRGQHLHHPDHVREIQKRCNEVGVDCVAILSDDKPATGKPREDFLKFMKRNLGVRQAN